MKVNPTNLRYTNENISGRGVLNFFDKSKADELADMGFKYTKHIINDNQTIYSFIDTPKLREIIISRYDKCEYYSSKYLYL